MRQSSVALPETTSTAPRDLPLAALAAHEQASVLALTGGYRLVGRLAALGFTPGAQITVIRNDGRGPLIVSVLGTQVALGRGQAMGIRVRPLER